MKDVLRNLKKHWITAWLVVVVLTLLGTFISRAVYTEVSSVKRVITTKSAPKELFSSNCMIAGLYERRMPSNEYNVDVRNFDPNDPETPNPVDIQYKLTAQLQVKYNGTIMSFSDLRSTLGGETDEYRAIVDRATVTRPSIELGSESTFGYFIGKSQDNNAVINSPQMIKLDASNDFQFVFEGPTTAGGSTLDYETLPGGSISTDRFKIIIPEDDFDHTNPEFYVYVKAEPTDAGLTQLIHTQLYGSKNEIATSAWSGTIAEKNTSTTDYDFYNYIISGSGSGKLDIMWDPDKFEIDDFFFDSTLSGVTFDESCLDGEGNVEIGTVSGVTHNGWNKVTIVVDSSEGKSRYELQLYKKMANTPYTGVNDAANFVDCGLQNSDNSNQEA